MPAGPIAWGRRHGTTTSGHTRMSMRPRSERSRSASASETNPLAARPLSQPHPRRLSPNAPCYRQIMEAHSQALAAGVDTYVDPASGLIVLTAGTLARRGSCCESGCRHCPYIA
jgi:Family of unknown function (DUF5522)